MKNDISQPLGLDPDNIDVYAEVYQNIPLTSRDKTIFTFFRIWRSAKPRPMMSHFAIVSLSSEFEPRQKLKKFQVSFDNLIGYILSISICMQNFITIFHSVQGIALLSLFFQNLELGKASTNEKCHLSISWTRSCQYQCLRNSLSKYSTQFKRYGYFHLSRIWRSAKHRPMINVILQFLELDLVNINVSAKLYQHIPNDLRVKFHCFQNLNLGKTSTNPKCHLTILWTTSYQYKCVCKISSQYSTQFKR